MFHAYFNSPMRPSVCPIKFFLPVTIAVIPDVLVTNLITQIYLTCLVVMTCQTTFAGVKSSITDTQNSQVTSLMAIA